MNSSRGEPQEAKRQTGSVLRKLRETVETPEGKESLGCWQGTSVYCRARINNCDREQLFAEESLLLPCIRILSRCLTAEKFPQSLSAQS